jgi:membrane associated rhomboid family serine protease
MAFNPYQQRFSGISLPAGTALNRLMLALFFLFLGISILRLVLLLGFRDPLAAATTFNSLMSWIAMPYGWSQLLIRPYTLITATFLHQGIFHFVFNMIALFFIGSHFQHFLGEKRVLPFFIAAGFTGNLISFLFGLLPSALTAGMGSYLLGASGAILGMLAASAWLYPDMPVVLPLIGRVKIIYILIFYVVLDILTMGNLRNVGGSFAHLGGAAFGLLYASLFKRGNDILHWSYPSRHPKRKNFSMGPGETAYKPYVTAGNTRIEGLRQRISAGRDASLDELLDKISEKGIQSLTAKERELLDKYSREGRD